MAASDEPQRHVVVFDCNIYLDIASLVGAPFAWSNFDKLAAQLAKESVPHPTDRAYDSLRAVATCTSGRFAGAETVEVWTNSHIDRITLSKATQSTNLDIETGYRGLGWSIDDARSLVADLVYGVLHRSNGGTLGDHFPDGNPPLDYEDGMVYGACRRLSAIDPLARVYCVTRDRGFLKASKEGRLDCHSTVLSPSRFVSLIRAARSQYSIRSMKPPNPS